jgi:hypothetical protein
MMQATNRNRELVADFASQRTRLRKGDQVPLHNGLDCFSLMERSAGNAGASRTMAARGPVRPSRRPAGAGFLSG